MSATRSSQIFHRCQEPERPIERDLTCGISPIGLAVSDNEVEIEYGSAVFSSGLRIYWLRMMKQYVWKLNFSAPAS